jgi:ABC-type glycerol-3-phosphate transport system substrate-binding protein
MSDQAARSNSLIRWMLEAPVRRLGQGVLLPLVILLGFIGALLVDFETGSDVVYYDPRKPLRERLVSRAAFENDKTGTVQKRVKVTYWEKWSGFEGQAIQDAVDAFNQRQDKIYVQLTIQGDITQKVRIATSGGDPPDLAGLYSVDVPVFGAQNALLPLDDRMKTAGISSDDYVAAYYDLCVYRGKTWALPTTPSTWALHWNKKLFREAGLDPKRPPRTIRELDEFARKLTKWAPRRPERKADETAAAYEQRLAEWRDERKLVQVGYLPTEPGWWKYPWGLWFGGELWNGKDRLTFNSPENVAAMRWIRRYADGKVYDGAGYEELDRFKKTFGGFSSSDNAFFTGKVAMEMQGVWMAKFVKKYAPEGFEYGVAPFPAVEDPEHPGEPLLEKVSVAEADVIGIPRGAKHPDEAFEFVRFMARPEGMEILCLGHGKHSPLKETSANWYENHPNPYVRVFEELAASPNCKQIPQIGIWRECAEAWNRTFDDVWTRKKAPKEALDDLQAEMQRRLEHVLARQRAVGANPEKDG